MNLNGDEKKIRQLFHEMSREDEHRIPAFARFIAAASSKEELSRNRTRSFAVAWVAAGIFIAMLIAVSMAMRHPGTQTQEVPRDQTAEATQSTERAPANTLPRPVLDAPRTFANRAIPKRVRRRRHSDELAIRMKPLFAWQSPTASLLKVPGEEMFRSLPRLGESLQSIKIFSPDEFN